MAEHVKLFLILTQQHQDLAELLTMLANEPSRRPTLFPMLEQQLLAHAKAEEQTLYAAVLGAGGKAAAPEVEESMREHQELAELLETMASLDADDESWDEELQTLTDLVLDHVEEEESDLYEMARRVLDDDTLAALAKSFERQHEQILMALGADPSDEN